MILTRVAVRRLILILTILLSTVGCDQITKSLARHSLTESAPLHFLGGTIVLQHAENPGAFLSLGAGMHSGLRFLIFTALVTIGLTLVFVFLVRKDKMPTITTVGWALLLGGGIGNLIDRVFKGSVTDFLNVGIGGLRTGIFNVADMAIVAAVLILLVAPGNEKKTA